MINFDAANDFDGLLDSICESPILRAQMRTNMAAQPNASSVLLQLLLQCDTLDIDAAFMAESLAYGVLQGSLEHQNWLSGHRQKSSSLDGHVIVTRTANRLEITLNRPTVYNAIDRIMRDRLREAFDVAAMDEEIEHVVLRGIGKAFCAGADLNEFGTTRDPAIAHAIRMQTLPAHAIARCSDKMTVHVHGACIGAGLEMVAFAKHISATHNAWFQLPELAMGLIPGAGGCISIPRRIGWKRTAQMILSGKRISASTALDWGLIDEIIDD